MQNPKNLISIRHIISWFFTMQPKSVCIFFPKQSHFMVRKSATQPCMYISKYWSMYQRFSTLPLQSVWSTALINIDLTFHSVWRLFNHVLINFVKRFWRSRDNIIIWDFTHHWINIVLCKLWSLTLRDINLKLS